MKNSATARPILNRTSWLLESHCKNICFLSSSSVYNMSLSISYRTLSTFHAEMNLRSWQSE